MYLRHQLKPANWESCERTRYFQAWPAQPRPAIAPHPQNYPKSSRGQTELKESQSALQTASVLLKRHRRHGDCCPKRANWPEVPVNIASTAYPTTAAVALHPCGDLALANPRPASYAPPTGVSIAVAEPTAPGRWKDRRPAFAHTTIPSGWLWRSLPPRLPDHPFPDRPQGLPCATAWLLQKA